MTITLAHLAGKTALSIQGFVAGLVFIFCIEGDVKVDVMELLQCPEVVI